MIIAPDYDVDALEILGQKKNRIILVRKEAKLPKKQFRALLNGVLVQDKDMNIETVADLRTVTDKSSYSGRSRRYVVCQQNCKEQQIQRHRIGKR